MAASIRTACELYRPPGKPVKASLLCPLPFALCPLPRLTPTPTPTHPHTHTPMSLTESPAIPNVEARAQVFMERYRRLREEIGKVIVGQDKVVESVLVAILAGGHALLEGVPGLGKTLLVR